MTRAEVDQIAEDTGEELLCADGFDDAIVGLGRQFTKTFVVYDYRRVIDTLISRDGMDEEEAREFFEFNIVGAWVGDATPCFLSVDA